MAYLRQVKINNYNYHDKYKTAIKALAIVSLLVLGLIVVGVITNNAVLEVPVFIFFICIVSVDIIMLWKFVYLKLDIAKKQIDELRKENFRLKREASVDSLTGAFNRNKFNEIISLELERCERYESQLSIIMFDIDDFKKINDTYGHSSGDAVLKDIGKVVGSNLRKTDFFIRWGGEEFIVIAPEIGIEKAMVLGEKIRRLVEESITTGFKKVTISVGVGEYSRGIEFKELFNNVDKALYLAKNSGKNNVKCIN